MFNKNLIPIKIFCNKIKKTLFTNLINTIVSIFIILIISLVCLNTFKWLIFNANWKVVTSNLPLYAFGSFPSNQQWRPATWIISLLSLSIVTLFGPDWKFVRKNLLLAWISTIPLGLYLLYGGLGLTPVMSRHWGGLTLTILLTACSSLLSLPFGIVLALCRQSSLPLIQKISSIYIDVMRAIPLIAVLFFGQLLIPLFLPIGIEIDRVWRAIFAFTLFVSAYIAEDVRGGLQAIPNTQIEAATSLGLNQYQVTKFVLIPQALRIALPALTNQSIGLFQNTSLMAILGLVELLGIGRSILANPEFIGQYIEVYIWLACVYWLFCTIMAVLARHLEQRMRINKENF
ncbi:amino acid ABC transporter permease [Prochlorococcus marinus]|uniref:Amino acid ABC transporter permease n=1 Tax=Prochlorococcus marinus XMU1408 TaxID=2213228 RepID=A0A318R6R9_PROMR|nr:amino acid ABC transporter permease [Prochlorococcus marinus]MBW3041082.1 amino acid ABC transporter permease [Prochlorococcus marinus str. XMU1408]PYE03687.1 amino acid ABC transporter permease [Prochlorococcus marinus XMU1408]